MSNSMPEIIERSLNHDAQQLCYVKKSDSDELLKELLKLKDSEADAESDDDDDFTPSPY